jgi:hypothetical protein
VSPGARDIFHALILPFGKINLMKPDTQKNLDVLQNFEFRIIGVFRADPSLLDLDVKDALEALVRHYRAEEEQRRPSALQLHHRAQQVFSAVLEVCEWRLGKVPFPGTDDMPDIGLPISEILECLKKIQKSVPFWSKEGGRQGYLNFVNQYIR